MRITLCMQKTHTHPTAAATSNPYAPMQPHTPAYYCYHSHLRVQLPARQLPGPPWKVQAVPSARFAVRQVPVPGSQMLTAAVTGLPSSFTSC
jgi:hypothetical protein